MTPIARVAEMTLKQSSAVFYKREDIFLVDCVLLFTSSDLGVV